MEDWIHFRKREGSQRGIHHAVSARERTGCLSQQGRQKGRVKAGAGGGKLHGVRRPAHCHFAPQGGDSPGESWPGTIKSSRQLTAKRQGAAHRGQTRAEMSNAG